ncbi:MAG: hypothetical protein AB7F32_10230 [Victivallaceae bacterium]
MIIISSLLLLLAGCGRKAAREISPNERNHLVIRMFHSLGRQDAASALEQAVKFRTLDPGNNYLTTIIETQRANTAIVEAQKRLDAKRPDEAAKVLEKGIKASPLNRHLGEVREHVRRLAALDAEVKALLAARGLDERGRSLVKLEQIAGELNHPELTAAVKTCRLKFDADIAADLERRRKELEKKNPVPADKTPPAPAVKTESVSPAPVAKQVP